MLRHYFLLGLRNLRRAPLTAALNVFTLALGLACFVVAYAFVVFWQRAEQHFANVDRIAVLTMHMDLLDGSLSFTNDPNTPEAAARYLEEDYPEIERVARAIGIGPRAAIASSGRALRVHAVAVDPQFPEIFDLPFVAGDARTALRAPGSAVVTEELAARLFGNADPLGASVRIENAVEATVVGVLAAMPEPSHMGRSASAALPFDVLVSYDVLESIRQARRDPNAQPPRENFLNGSGLTYLLLPADGRITVESLRNELGAFAERHVPPEMAAFAKLGFGAIPVSALLGNAVDGELFAFGGGDLSVAGVLMVLATVVLAVACINYANLATARAARRVQEVGLRKALGARPAQVMGQYLFEAALVTAMAFAVALVVCGLLEPWLATLAGADLGAIVRTEAGFWLSLLGVALAATLAAGAYPAFVLSRVLPLRALRVARARLGPKALSTLLVGGQFAVASFLLIVFTITTLQNRHLLRTGIGTTSDPLLIIENDKAATEIDTATLREELARIPQVRGVTEVGMIPWESVGMTAVAASPGMDAVAKGVLSYNVGYDFFSVFDVPVLAGRVFSPERFATDFPGAGAEAPSGQPRAIVVDRAFAEEFGFAAPESAVEQTVYFPQSTMAAFGFGAQPLTIIGVVENKAFSFFGPNGVATAMYQLQPDLRFHVARVAADDVAGALGAIDDAWRRLAPEVPISRRFLDAVFEENYATFARVGSVLSALAAMAFLISVSGLFGMATLIASRRLPEIGVRKTLGANTAQMARLLSSSFAAPVLLANLLAWPLAYLAARSYLDTLLSPIEIDVWPFALSLLAMLGSTSLAVGGQTLRAARARPADVLRYE